MAILYTYCFWPYFFYFLTTFFNVGLTVISFVLNFILWVAEQVNLESTFHDSIVYQLNDRGFTVCLLGGFLWATNKLILDWVFIKCKAKIKPANRLNKLKIFHFR